jgi:hypothetical protein
MKTSGTEQSTQILIYTAMPTLFLTKLLGIHQRGTDNQNIQELKKLSSPKINEPINKWATELNRTFSKEEVQIAKKHMKKCSPSLTIKEMRIKTTLKFHLTPVRTAIIKNSSNNRCW